MCFDGGDGSGGAGIGGYGTDTNEDGRTSLVESLRDMTDGGGKGRSGDTFEGALSSISNTLGATPRGSDREPTGVAKFASEVTGIGGRANPTSGALLGALTGGIPGMALGYASARGRNAVEDAGGLGSLLRGQTADATMGDTSTATGAAVGQSLRPQARPGQATGGYRSGGGGGGNNQPAVVEPTVTSPEPTVPLTMSESAAEGGFQPIPNPNYDPADPMSPMYLSNPTYAQLLAYRDSQIGGTTPPPVQAFGSRLSGVVAMAEGGEVMGGNEKTAIADAVSAIKGELSEVRAAIVLGKFLESYGEDALRNLVTSVQSGELDDTVGRFANGEAGEVRGPGDGSGVDDKVPASLEGQQDVLLADGEFVLRKKTADALQKKYGGGFLDAVNKAENDAPRTMQQYMARN